jgi:hypothetical protein
MLIGGGGGGGILICGGGGGGGEGILTGGGGGDGDIAITIGILSIFFFKIGLSNLISILFFIVCFGDGAIIVLLLFGIKVFLKIVFLSSLFSIF